MSDDGRVIVQFALLPESIKSLERGEFVYFIWIEPHGDAAGKGIDHYTLHAHVPADVSSDSGEAYIRAVMDDDYGHEGPPSPEVEKLRDAFRERMGW